MRKISMNINKDTIYVCSKITSKSYAEPTKEMVNIQPTNQDGDILVYGTNYSEYARIIDGDVSKLDYIKENDKVYYAKALPTTHDIAQTSQTSANFFVSGRPTVTKNVIDIRLKRISSR